MERLKTLLEAAEILNVDNRVLHELVAAGDIPVVLIVTHAEVKYARIEPQDLRDFVQGEKRRGVGSTYTEKVNDLPGGSALNRDDDPAAETPGNNDFPF